MDMDVRAWNEGLRDGCSGLICVVMCSNKRCSGIYVLELEMFGSWSLDYGLDMGWIDVCSGLE